MDGEDNALIDFLTGDGDRFAGASGLKSVLDHVADHATEQRRIAHKFQRLVALADLDRALRGDRMALILLGQLIHKCGRGNRDKSGLQFPVFSHGQIALASNFLDEPLCGTKHVLDYITALLWGGPDDLCAQRDSPRGIEDVMKEDLLQSATAFIIADVFEGKHIELLTIDDDRLRRSLQVEGIATGQANTALLSGGDPSNAAE
ncbi:MAG: hypothetical protein IPK19_29460 [Chloroflexi bacterium]|nr:hypothetical protein [Chloroflexota bacterium]